MRRRHFITLAATGAIAGCAELSGGEENGRLALTVQNERPDRVTARITVVDDEGTTYEDRSDQIDSSVARAFEVVVGTGGRHEVTVAGEDWRGQLAWNVDTCALFDGTVRTTAEAVEVAGECVDPQ